MASTTIGMSPTPSARHTTQGVAELQDLLQPMLEELALTEGYDRAYVVLTNNEQTDIVAAFGVNVPYDLYEPANDPGDLPRLYTTALQEGRVIRVEDVLRDP